MNKATRDKIRGTCSPRRIHPLSLGMNSAGILPRVVSATRIKRTPHRHLLSSIWGIVHRIESRHRNLNEICASVVFVRLDSGRWSSNGPYPMPCLGNRERLRSRLLLVARTS